MLENIYNKFFYKEAIWGIGTCKINNYRSNIVKLLLFILQICYNNIISILKGDSYGK